MKMDNKEIKELVKKFMRGRDDGYCHASFDYCFNYFQSFENKAELAAPENIQQSCLHLGYFLASWGMFRSRKLAKKTSLTHYSKIIREIASWDEQLLAIWKTDADGYSNDQTRKLLLKCYAAIKNIALPAEQKAELTLTTKIMLGVFGCIPAFDCNFKKTFGRLYKNKFFEKFDEQALIKLADFYKNNGHSKTIDELAIQTNTLDFETGKKTSRHYTRAKIIDMIGFQMEENKNGKKKKSKE